MPDLDGWNVMAALRSDVELADIPVVMATIVDEQRHGMALGAVAYLTKPIDRDELIQIIRRLRHRPHLDECSWSMTIPPSASASAPGLNGRNGCWWRQKMARLPWSV